jgi:hypothetical protein
MPNINKANGARPIKHLNGSLWDSQVNKYFIPLADTNIIAAGDFVKLSGLSDGQGVPAITKAAPGDALLGVVVSVYFDPDDLKTTYRKTATARYAFVCDDPTVIYELQENAATDPAALGSDDVGLNINFSVGVITPVGGVGTSANQLDSATKGVAGTLPLKTIRKLERVGNELGAFCRWEVVINNHQRGVAATQATPA